MPVSGGRGGAGRQGKGEAGRRVRGVSPSHTLSPPLLHAPSPLIHPLPLRRTVERIPDAGGDAVCICAGRDLRDNRHLWEGMWGSTWAVHGQYMWGICTPLCHPNGSILLHSQVHSMEPSSWAHPYTPLPPHPTYPRPLFSGAHQPVLMYMPPSPPPYQVLTNLYSCTCPPLPIRCSPTCTSGPPSLSCDH